MAEQEESFQQRHVRPSRRKPNPSSNNDGANIETLSSTRNNDLENVDDATIEQTRLRMESWMGLGKPSLGDRKQAASTVSIKRDVVACPSSKSPPTGVSHTAFPSTMQSPASILKKSKYAKGNSAPPGVSSTPKATQQIVSPQQTAPGGTITPIQEPVEIFSSQSTSVPSSAAPIICKDVVLERDPRRPVPKIAAFRKPRHAYDDEYSSSGIQDQYNPNDYYATAIEGHIPSHTTAAAIEMPRNSVVRESIPRAATSTSTRDTQSKRKPLKTADEMDYTEQVETSCSNRKRGEDINDDQVDEEGPLILNSLAELMEAAGETLPQQGDGPARITDDTKMVEAEIAFSVMTQDQYESNLSVLKREREEEVEEQMNLFMGKQDVFGDADEEDDGGSDVENDEDDNGMMELLMASDADDDWDAEDDEEERPLPEPRAFRLLWQALTNWMTHATVSWVMTLEDTENAERNRAMIETECTPMVDRSDIGASRCAGVMAMLRLYLSGCMSELGHTSEERRRSEKRLTDILRTFDYSRENPRLQVNLWKAMTCILLDMVLVETRSDPITQLPPSVAAVGMTIEEFRYLTRNTVTTFGLTVPAV